MGKFVGVSGLLVATLATVALAGCGSSSSSSAAKTTTTTAGAVTPATVAPTTVASTPAPSNTAKALAGSAAAPTTTAVKKATVNIAAYCSAVKAVQASEPQSGGTLDAAAMASYGAYAKKANAAAALSPTSAKPYWLAVASVSNDIANNNIAASDKDGQAAFTQMEAAEVEVHTDCGVDLS